MPNSVCLRAILNCWRSPRTPFNTGRRFFAAWRPSLISICRWPIVPCAEREAAIDPDFATSVEWDVPLLQGYSWAAIPNKGSGQESFWGLNNTGLSKLICDGKFDAVLCLVGYVRASFWVARRAATRTASRRSMAKPGKAFQNRIAVISVPPAGALPCYAEMVPLLAILQAFLEMR